jgi:hypothetical protein
MRVVATTLGRKDAELVTLRHGVRQLAALAGRSEGWVDHRLLDAIADLAELVDGDAPGGSDAT